MRFITSLNKEIRKPCKLLNQNLYPCGEGAGYAGGIVSAAMDGQKLAQQIALGYGIVFPRYHN